MRVLVLGAGGPAGMNTCLALEAAGHDAIALDERQEHLVWLQELGFDATAIPFMEWLPHLHGEGVELVMPQADALVPVLAHNRDAVHEQGVATVLPDTGTILVCQDKFETGRRWAKAGLRSYVTRLDDPTEDIDEAADRYGFPFWIRATRGAGARASARVENLRNADAWVDYWLSRDPEIELIAEEYLPGRDLAWCGVYQHGRLVASFARERLEYIYPGLTPSGLTGTPAVARVIHDERVNDVAEYAVEAIDIDWHGVACVDLREDLDDVPRPTEINAGRTCTTVPLYHEAGLNVPDLVCGLAGTASVPSPRRDAVPAGTTLHRHIDCGHVFTMAREPAYA